MRFASKAGSAVALAVSVGMASAQITALPASAPAAPMSPAEIAATVESLIAIDAKAALNAAKPASAGTSASSAKGSPSRKAAESAPVEPTVEVEYILGQGKKVTAGLLVNGAQVIAEVGSIFGAPRYKVVAIDMGCITAMMPVKADVQSRPSRKRARAEGSRLAADRDGPVITQHGKTWCFVETNAPVLTAQPTGQMTGPMTAQLPTLMPRGTPLPSPTSVPVTK